MKELSNMSLEQHLDELAAFEPEGFPFISLYLNTQPDQHGRDNFEPFVRKEFNNRLRTFDDGSPEQESFERDMGRIGDYLKNELRASANGLIVFACAGANDYFKAIELDAPVQTNDLHVAERPYLYPLARLIDQYPRYIALVADTDVARLFVFDLGQTKRSLELDNTGGSLAHDGVHTQLRYQRRTQNHNFLHAKEVVEMLARVAGEEDVQHIILAGDEVIIPLLRERLPAHLAKKVIDVLRLDIRTPEHKVLKATMESLREDNIQTDAEKVRDLFDKYRAGGLAVVGLRDTLNSFVHGQVDELLLSASIEEIRVDEEPESAVYPTPAAAAAGTVASSSSGSALMQAHELSPEVFADALISLARSTGAAVTFIEDGELLAGVGGVGAILRYRI